MTTTTTTFPLARVASHTLWHDIPTYARILWPLLVFVALVSTVRIVSARTRSRSKARR